jgi:hypothetical protein
MVDAAAEADAAAAEATVAGTSTAADEALTGALATTAGASALSRRLVSAVARTDMRPVETTDMPSVAAKNTVAQTAVERDRKVRAAGRAEQAARGAAAEGRAHVGALAVLDQHEADHRDGGQDLQNEEKIRPDLHFAWSSRKWFRVGRRPSAGRPADGDEIGGLQRGPADQSAIDILLREQRRGVVRLDAAAVQQRHRVGMLRRGV